MHDSIKFFDEERLCWSRELRKHFDGRTFLRALKGRGKFIKLYWKGITKTAIFCVSMVTKKEVNGPYIFTYNKDFPLTLTVSINYLCPKEVSVNFFCSAAWLLILVKKRLIRFQGSPTHWKLTMSQYSDALMIDQ